jgi:hypothetical protein
MNSPEHTPSQDELDRGTSRRVDHETAATADDERAYAAATPATEPETDQDTGGSGGTADRAAQDLESEGDEPERSE